VYPVCVSWFDNRDNIRWRESLPVPLPSQNYLTCINRESFSNLNELCTVILWWDLLNFVLTQITTNDLYRMDPSSKPRKQILILFDFNSPFREWDAEKLNICLQCIHGNELAMQTSLLRHYDATITAIIYGLTQMCIMMALTTQRDTYWDIRHAVKWIDTTVRRYLYVYLVKVCREHV
jgi:hypothetical protein